MTTAQIRIPVLPPLPIPIPRAVELSDIVFHLVYILAQAPVNRQPDYRERINAFGGVDCLIQRAMQSWRTEFKALFRPNETLDANALVALVVLQSDILFTKPGCYVDIVTDDNDPAWHRFYVGQSVGLYNRTRDHLEAIQKMKTSSPHYHVASKPGRRPNLVITTDINTKGLSTRQLETLLDVLEMAQVLALQSLPEATLRVYLPSDTLIANPNVHLNEASPLCQHSFSPLDKQFEAEKLAGSQDPDIQSWYKAGKERKLEMTKIIQCYIIGTDYQRHPNNPEGYREAVLNAFGNPTPASVENFLTDCQRIQSKDDTRVSSAFKTLAKADQDSYPGDLPNLIYPQGTFNSQIAILLEEPNSLMSLNDGECDANAKLAEKYPAHFGKKGLTLDKCLVFYTYYRQRLMRLSDQDCKLPVNTRETEELERHEDFCDLVLQESPASAILLCGKLQAKRVLEQNGSSLRLLFLKFGLRHCQSG